TRLSSFETIDLKDWRYHLGDIPNGEDPALDDSSWQTVTPIKKDLPTEAVWFRREIVVPKQLNGYDLTNAEVEFHVAVGAAGPATLILYMDGRRVALGADLGSIVLWQKAHPGDHTLIAVKALASDVNKVFRSASLSVTTDPLRPSPSDFAKEATSDSWMLPAIPGGAAQAHLLEEAVAAIDTKALEADDNKAFDASLLKAHHILESLRPLLQQANIHMVGNSHMDAAWMWPWTETVETVRQTFGTSLQLMDEYPQYTYTQSAAQYFEWIQDKYPVEFARIQRRVKEGRFELVGGMWIEPDLNIPGEESQVRQILIGKRYFQKNLGVDVRIGWNPDTFGYNWQLPQIYKKSGIDYFVTQKMQWNETNQLPLKLFWWQAPDGSRVLTYFPHGYGNGTQPVDMAKDYAQASALNPGIGEMMHLYGVGDHGGGPTRMSVNQGEHWQQPDKIYPHVEFGTAQSFFSNVEQHLDTTDAPTWNYSILGTRGNVLPQPKPNEIALPIWNDELYLEYHRGTYTTQASQKSGIRSSEEMLLNAEKFSSLAWLTGQPYPGNELNDAWKKVLFNEFHDLAAGSGIADIYKDAHQDFRDVRLATNQANTQALATLSSYIDTQTPDGSVPLLVFNSMAWKRTGLVEAHVQLPTASKSISIHDAAGRALPLQVLHHTAATNSFDVLLRIDGMPALGYEKLIASPASTSLTSSQLKVTATSLENEYLRVVVDAATGCITSLFDKHSHFDSIAAGGCGNQLQAFHDLPKAWDAWNIDADLDTKPFDLGLARNVQLVESGPLRSIIRVTHSTAASKFVQDITLYAGIDRVDVSNNIDWHEQHILLKAAFPLAASSPKATYEIPFGSIQRPTTRNNSFESAMFEVPAIRWADLGDAAHGFSLLNSSKYGYDAKGNVLRLTLLRSTKMPDPDADQGLQHFVYALYPHAGSWQSALTEREGWDFNYPLVAQQTERHSGSLPPAHSFVEVSPANIVLTAMKKAEDSDALILRFYEWAGQPTNVTLRLPHNVATASSVNLMEQPDPTPVSIDGDTATTAVTPYSIDSIKVTFSGTGTEYFAHP
ncbi:MAG: glycoside hydrolase family 38 C-terminal domain-containing protein, partial [Acidobacteriota bacterium]